MFPSVYCAAFRGLLPPGFRCVIPLSSFPLLIFSSMACSKPLFFMTLDLFFLCAFWFRVGFASLSDGVVCPAKDGVPSRYRMGGCNSSADHVLSPCSGTKVQNRSKSPTQSRRGSQVGHTLLVSEGRLQKKWFRMRAHEWPSWRRQ